MDSIKKKAEGWLQKSCDMVMSLWPQPNPHAELIKNLRVVAHRGAHDNVSIFENTQHAFQRALDVSAWAVEFDIRFTSDDTPIIHHDASTERIFRKNLIIAKSSSQDLRKHVPLIPPLEETLEHFGQRLHWMIEVKPQELNARRVDRLLGILRSFRPTEDYHLLGLNPAILEPFHQLPNESLILVPMTNVRLIVSELQRRRWGGIAGHYVLIPPVLRAQLIRQGYEVGVGFIASKNSLFREMRYEQDWIFTNHAPLLKKITDSFTAR